MVSDDSSDALAAIGADMLSVVAVLAGASAGRVGWLIGDCDPLCGSAEGIEVDVVGIGTGPTADLEEFSGRGLVSGVGADGEGAEACGATDACGVEWSLESGDAKGLGATVASGGLVGELEGSKRLALDSAPVRASVEVVGDFGVVDSALVSSALVSCVAVDVSKRVVDGAGALSGATGTAEAAGTAPLTSRRTFGGVSMPSLQSSSSVDLSSPVGVGAAVLEEVMGPIDAGAER